MAGEKLIGKSLEPRARANAIGGATAADALAIIARDYPEGSEMSEGIAVTILNRGADLAQRRDTLAALRSKYKVELGPKVLNTLVAKAQNPSEAAEIIHQSGIQPDESVLCTILQRASLIGIRGIVDNFTKKYGAPLTGTTLNAIIDRHSEISSPLHTLGMLTRRFGIEPNDRTYRTLLYKALAVEHFTTHTLHDLPLLIQRFEKSGNSMEVEIQKSPMLQVLYARYLFTQQKPADAMRILGPLLQAKTPDRYTGRIVVAMIFSFLPPDHPMRAAVEQGLRGKSEDLLKQAIEDQANFAGVFAEWLKRKNSDTRGQLGGGTVFDDLHETPVDAQARKDVFPYAQEG